jgi:hypothetical protein
MDGEMTATSFTCAITGDSNITSEFSPFLNREYPTHLGIWCMDIFGSMKSPPGGDNGDAGLTGGVRKSHVEDY